jgi:hypothetical protein
VSNELFNGKMGPLIVFCNNFISPLQPDADFTAEYEAARRAGFATALISLENLQAGEVGEAIRRVPVSDEQRMAVYRGWMLRPAEYETLYRALLVKNVHLINSADEYRAAHLFPNMYEAIRDHTPLSISFPLADPLNLDELMARLTVFEGQPVMVKDYVKSEKHHWHEACFIPSSTERAVVGRVTTRFLELRGSSLNEGLVFRQFVELEPLATHAASGMPMAKEFRFFYVNHQLVAQSTYWSGGDYGDTQPDPHYFAPIAARISSHFFTLDVARTKQGRWLVLEAGDGQVSGLPETLDPNDFYDQLYRALNHPVS